MNDISRICRRTLERKQLLSKQTFRVKVCLLKSVTGWTVQVDKRFQSLYL